MRETDWYILTSLLHTKNITKSADELYMTQPTITKRIMGIEEHYGIKILRRSNKGVTFTPEGEYLAERASELTSAFGRIDEAMKSYASGKKSEIRLVMPNSIGRFHFPQIMREYHKICPDVEFNVQTVLSDKISAAMEAGEASVGFVCGDYRFSGEKSVVYEEQNFLAYIREVTLIELPNLPRIEYVKGIFTKELLEGWISEHFPCRLRVSFSVDNGDTALEMVRSGMGYSFFSAGKFLDGDKELFRMPLFTKSGAPLVRRAWMLWYKKDYDNSASVKNFVDFVRSGEKLFD